MQYTVVYDAIQSGLHIHSIALMAMWAIGPIYFAVIAIRNESALFTSHFLSMTTFYVGWYLIGGVGFLHVYSAQARCEKWLETGQYIVSEGIVEDFDPNDLAGGRRESFRLGEYRFQYSDSSLGEDCFNNMRRNGGPIYAGRRVRLLHNEGRILRIEVPSN